MPLLPTLLIGGWLGSGKTTLINHLLRHAEGRRVAVLVNDFGDVNIDADLILGASAGVLQLSGGCLCCSFGDDLLSTLRRVAQMRPPPQQVLIELSGVALPGAVQRTLLLSTVARCVGTLVLVDAPEVQRLASDRYVGDTVCQQLAAADWLLLNKTDVPGAPDVPVLSRWLQERAPQARCLPGPASDIPPELAFGWLEADLEPTSGGAQGQDNASSVAGSGVLAPTGWSPRPLSAGHAHFGSRSLRLEPGANLERLAQCLGNPAMGVLRAKALVGDSAGQGRLLQWAAGRAEVRALPVAQPGGWLVVLGLRQAMTTLPENALAEAAAPTQRLLP